MLKRIFADNFRALVNFEFRPGPLSLLLGGNGSGKTSVFEALGSITDLVVLGRPVSELFSLTRTRWETRDVQRFELDLQSGEGTYRYALEIEHPEDTPGKPFIRSETVTLDGSLLYRFSARLWLGSKGSCALFRRTGQLCGPVRDSALVAGLAGCARNQGRAGDDHLASSGGHGLLGARLSLVVRAALRARHRKAVRGGRRVSSEAFRAYRPWGRVECKRS